MFKTCTQCLKHKHIDDYHKHSKGKYGRFNICKECRISIHQRKLIYNPLDKKECNQCYEEKCSDNFYKNSFHKTGLFNICKKCFQENRQKVIENMDLYFEKIVAQYNEKNLENKITIEKVKELYKKQNQKCAITNHNLTFYIFLKKKKKDGSLDFIWNLTILDKETLVCNFIYSASKIYNYNFEQLKEIYQELIQK